ncbi:MAG: DUF4139 domain-containing protein [Flavobacteriales bacterium]|nr:DUF4139 domain-containing protein [Flavobacteriales bacterium]
MKKIALTFTGILLTLSSYSATSKQQLITKIESVVVYLDGAEISRNKQVNLSPGKTEIVFKELSPDIISKTIRVAITDEVSILSISNRISYLEDVTQKPKIKSILASIEVLEDKKIMIADEMDALEIEKSMILKNQFIGGDQGITVEGIKNTADFFRSKITEINKLHSALKKKKLKTIDDLNIFQKELKQYRDKGSSERTEVIIEVLVDKNVSPTISLKYVVEDAGWVANYDIRAKEVNAPIHLKYMAKIYNQSQIDWENVTIKLSSQDPLTSASKPKLKPWIVSYNSRNRDNKYGYNDMDKYSSKGKRVDVSSMRANQSKVGTMITTSLLSAEFIIANKHSIPSDGKAYMVNVSSHDLTATYNYYSVPKLERDVFLLGRITDWENVNLITGYANIYFGDTYIGQSMIDTRTTNDTLDVSLGRDDKLVVTRFKKKEFSKMKTIGSNRKELHAYTISVKNNRTTPIKMRILDQLPISQNNEIVINPINTSLAKENEDSGELSWDIELKPGETKSFDLIFTIKYPKNKQITVSMQYKNVRFM